MKEIKTKIYINKVYKPNYSDENYERVYVYDNMTEEYQSTFGDISDSILKNPKNFHKYHFLNKKYFKKTLNEYIDKKVDDRESQHFKNSRFSAFQNLLISFLEKIFEPIKIKNEQIKLANHYLKNKQFDDYINFVSHGYNPTKSQKEKTDILFFKDPAFREKTFNKLNYPLTRKNIFDVLSFDILMNYIYGNNTYAFPESIHKTLQNPKNSDLAWGNFTKTLESTFKWVNLEVSGGSTTLVHRQDKYLTCLFKHFVNEWDHKKIIKIIYPRIKTNNNLPLLSQEIENCIIYKTNSINNKIEDIKTKLNIECKNVLDSINSQFSTLENFENLDPELLFNIENMKNKAIPNILANYAKIPEDKRHIQNSSGKDADSLVFDALSKIEQFLISKIQIIDHLNISELSAQHKYIESLTQSNEPEKEKTATKLKH